MGWGNCGEDSKGRQIGYAHDATCDHPGCKAEIHRGLAYACGGMHGKYAHEADIEVCEGYFCSEHMHSICVPGHDGDTACIQVCAGCEKEIGEIKAEALVEALISIVDVADDPEAVKALIYETLLGWDETSGLPLDEKLMPPKVYERLSAYRVIDVDFSGASPQVQA